MSRTISLLSLFALVAVSSAMFAAKPFNVSAYVLGPDLPSAAPVVATSDWEVAMGIDGDWMVYHVLLDLDSPAVIDNIEVRYQNFVTAATGTVPRPDGFSDRMPDVDDGVVVFRRDGYAGVGDYRFAIYLFDLQNPQNAPIELDPMAHSGRDMPSIGGNTVAWVHRGILPLGDGNDIPSLVVYDRTDGTTTTLAGDANHQVFWPSVSPDGNYVAWMRCANSATGCDVVQATRNQDGTWNVSDLAADPAVEETYPRVSEARVVYSVAPAGSPGAADIAWQDIGGGNVETLGFAGGASYPDTSGRLIVFSHHPVDLPVGEGDSIWVYDTATGALRRAADGTPPNYRPRVSTSLDGPARVVWGRAGDPDSGDIGDIWGVNFQLNSVDVAGSLGSLIELVEGLGLHHGITNSLLAKLNGAATALESGDTATACSLLNDFSAEVQAQSGKKISSDQAANLLEAATEIRTAIGCS